MVQEKARKSPGSGFVVGPGGHAGRTPASVLHKMA